VLYACIETLAWIAGILPAKGDRLGAPSVRLDRQAPRHKIRAAQPHPPQRFELSGGAEKYRLIALMLIKQPSYSRRRPFFADSVDTCRGRRPCAPMRRPLRGYRATAKFAVFPRRLFFAAQRQAPPSVPILLHPSTRAEDTFDKARQRTDSASSSLVVLAHIPPSVQSGRRAIGPRVRNGCRRLSACQLAA